MKALVYIQVVQHYKVYTDVILVIENSNSSNAWKMGSSGSTLSNGIRFFHYYSTDASAKLQWAKPGFYRDK